MEIKTEKVRKVYFNEELVTLKEKDDEVGVIENFCSDFVPSKRALLRGENMIPSNFKRNNVITVSDTTSGKTLCKDKKTGNLKGGSSSSTPVGSFR